MPFGTKHIMKGSAFPRPAGTYQAFPRPNITTVFVWEPVGGVGHASIAIGDQGRFNHGNWYEQTEGYASWFPGTSTANPAESGADARGILPSRMYMKESCTFANDCDSEGGIPENVIELSRLNVQHMMQLWTEIRDKPNAHYRLLRKNCSTIVARILRAGMSSMTGWQQAKVQYSAHCLYWTPADIVKFASELFVVS
jgi:hypothetical protein